MMDLTRLLPPRERAARRPPARARMCAGHIDPYNGRIQEGRARRPALERTPMGLRVDYDWFLGSAMSSRPRVSAGNRSAETVTQAEASQCVGVYSLVMDELDLVPEHGGTYGQRSSIRIL